LTTIQKFLSFEKPKQSVSNAFQYVVLHPAALRTSVSIMATMADSICKSTKKNGNNEGKGRKKLHSYHFSNL
jgi:hypothetical protein